MNQRIIRHLTNAVIFTVVYYFVGRDVALEQAAIFGGIYLLISIVMEKIMGQIRTRKLQDVGQEEGKGLSLPVDALITAVGGKENIGSVDAEASRLKLSLLDVDQINQEDLKKVAADGAYLSGNELQISMADHAEQMVNHIREAIQ